MINVNFDADNIRKQLEQEVQQAWKELFIKRPFIKDLKYDDYRDFMQMHAKKIILRMKHPHDFEIDGNCKFVVDNLYKWIVGDESFEIKPGTRGSLYKGIILYGNIGCGKSTTLEAMTNLYMGILKRNYCYIETEKFADYMKSTTKKRMGNNGETYSINDEDKDKKKVQIFDLSPKFIDDLGREAEIVHDYKNIIHPMKKLITHCYDKGLLVFATTNIPKDDQLAVYENYLGTRLTSFCNYMYQKGGNRRDKL